MGRTGRRHLLQPGAGPVLSPDQEPRDTKAVPERVGIPTNIGIIFQAWNADPVARICIPVEPMSVNRIYKRGRNIGLYKTKECKDYQAYIAHYAKSSILFKKPLTDQLCVHYTFCFTRRGRDADNPIKPIADCLQGVVYENDKQIRKFAVETLVNKDTPFILLWVGTLGGE